MKPTALISIDLEDWTQLAGRSLGNEHWDEPSTSFSRQVDSLLRLFDDLDVKATFFVLGVTAQHHRALLKEIADAGHPLACHGWGHLPVHSMTESEFRDDVSRCIELIESASGHKPLGYRAPAFSMTRATVWAYEILAELGFAYDSSQNDSPRIKNRIKPVSRGAFDITLPSLRTLREIPPAIAHLGPLSLPVGGGSYWRVLPGAVIQRGLKELTATGAEAALYFHPYEFDPESLVTPKSHMPMRARLLEMRYNLRNGATARLLNTLAQRFELSTYEASLGKTPRFGPATLCRTGKYI